MVSQEEAERRLNYKKYTAFFKRCRGVTIFDHPQGDSTAFVAGALVPVKAEGRGYQYKVLLMWSFLDRDFSIRIAEDNGSGDFQTLHITKDNPGFFVDDTRASSYTFNTRIGGGIEFEMFRVSSSDMAHIDPSVLQGFLRSVDDEQEREALKEIYGDDDLGSWALKEEPPSSAEVIKRMGKEEFRGWYQDYITSIYSRFVEQCRTLIEGEGYSYKGGSFFAFGVGFECVDGDFRWQELPVNYRQYKPLVLFLHVWICLPNKNNLKRKLRCFDLKSSYRHTHIRINRVSIKKDSSPFEFRHYNPTIKDKQPYTAKSADSCWYRLDDSDLSHYEIDFGAGRFVWSIEKDTLLSLSKDQQEFAANQGQDVFEEKPLDQLIEEAMIAVGGRENLSVEEQENIEKRVRSEFATRKRKRERFKRTQI